MELSMATALIAYDHAWSLGQTEQISAVMTDSAVRQRYSVEMARVSAQAIIPPAAPEPMITTGNVFAIAYSNRFQ